MGSFSNGVRLADINSDGLVDILKGLSDATCVNQTWINNGTGWVEDDSWNPPECFEKELHNETTPYDLYAIQDYGVRFADINGDGKVDIIKNRAFSSTCSESNGKVWLNNGTRWKECPGTGFDWNRFESAMIARNFSYDHQEGIESYWHIKKNDY